MRHLGAHSAGGLHFLFWGQDSRERLCRIGPGRSPDSRAAAPPGFPFMQETGVLSGRGQRAVCASRGEPRRCPAGRLWGWAGWYFLWEARVPCPPFGSRFYPEPVQGPALAWAGIHGTSSCQGWAVGGAQREACQNHWERACSVSWVCRAVFASSQSKSEGIGSPAP